MYFCAAFFSLDTGHPRSGAGVSWKAEFLFADGLYSLLSRHYWFPIVSFFSLFPVSITRTFFHVLRLVGWAFPSRLRSFFLFPPMLLTPFVS